MSRTDNLSENTLTKSQLRHYSPPKKKKKVKLSLCYLFFFSLWIKEKRWVLAKISAANQHHPWSYQGQMTLCLSSLHLWAVISVSINLSPSNLGVNFSMEAGPCWSLFDPASWKRRKNQAFRLIVYKNKNQTQPNK